MCWGRWLEPRQALRVAFVASQVGVLIDSIASTVIVIDVYKMIGFPTNFPIQVSVPPFPSPLLRAMSDGADGVEGLRGILKAWRCSSLIGVSGCTGWPSDCAWVQGVGRRRSKQCRTERHSQLMFSNLGGDLLDQVLENLPVYATPVVAHAANSHSIPLYLWH